MRPEDEAEFTGLVERQWRFAYRVAWAVLRNRADAEDAAQETFLKIFERGRGADCGMSGRLWRGQRGGPRWMDWPSRHTRLRRRNCGLRIASWRWRTSRPWG